MKHGLLIEQHVGTMELKYFISKLEFFFCFFFFFKFCYFKCGFFVCFYSSSAAAFKYKTITGTK